VSLKRVVLLRHGETIGQSSVRFHGATDVALAGLGADQARAAGSKIGVERFELVVASPLQRAWKTATLVAPGQVVRLEAGFREIDFGRWEGLTLEEIEASDPDLYRERQKRKLDFVYPGGESRDSFRARVVAVLGLIMSLNPRSLLVVCHKGVVRTIAEELSGVVLAPEEPELGGALELRREVHGGWRTQQL
jgi:broad specificity phosphatase PhoE